MQGREIQVGIPLLQQVRLARYVIGQQFFRNTRYPLVLMLEPLFRCNLRCAGCGKITYPEEILNRRLSMEECLGAAEECGAPVVAIGGGEPFLHQDMPRIVSGLVEREKFVYLCTNGLLLASQIKAYHPSPYLTFSIHLDGFREQHDSLAGREGVYDAAIEAITLARKERFRVTVNCTVYEGVSPKKQALFFDFVMGLGVEGITVSPAYRYERASARELSMRRRSSFRFFRELFKYGKGRGWKFNHSSLFLDFLAGNQDYQCTPWGNPTRNVFGWQRPCYLRVGEGAAPTFRSLIEETDWTSCGPGKDARCAECMLHSGYEPSAVRDAVTHPWKAFFIFLQGPRTEGPIICTDVDSTHEVVP